MQNPEISLRNSLVGRKLRNRCWFRLEVRAAITWTPKPWSLVPDGKMQNAMILSPGSSPDVVETATS